MCFQVVARVVWETLEGLTSDNRNLVLSLLHYTRCTAVCEILQPDHQHIVNLSHLTKPQLCVLSLTPAANCDDTDDPGSLLALPPNHMLDLFASLGFTCPTYKEVPVHTASEHKDAVSIIRHSCQFLFYSLSPSGIQNLEFIWHELNNTTKMGAIPIFFFDRFDVNYTQKEMSCTSLTRKVKQLGWLKLKLDGM